MPAYSYAAASKLYILSYHDLKEQSVYIIQRHIDFVQSTNIPITSLSKRTHDTTSVTFVIENATPQILRKIAPIFQQEDLPLTILIAFDDWRKKDDLSFLTALSNVTIGIYPMANDVFHEPSIFTENLNRAVSKYRETFNAPPEVFAFPQGLYTEDMLAITQKYSFDALIGQEKGVASINDYKAVFPTFRFEIDKNSSLEELAMVLKTEPLSLMDITPNYTLSKTPHPVLGYTLTGDDEGIIKCFSNFSGQIKEVFQIKRRIEVRPQLSAYQRMEINCSLEKLDRITGEATWKKKGFLFQYVPGLNLQDELP